jgi:transcriptional regulator with GAF, ATPase, and Fis domain
VRLNAAEKKQRNLIFLSLGLLIAAAAAVAVLGFVTEQNPVYISFLGLFVFLFCLYVIEGEIRLHKLNDQLRQEEFNVLEEQVKQSLLSSEIKKLTVLYKGLEMVGREKSPIRSLGKILEVLMEVFGADRGSVMLLNEPTQELVIISSFGIPKDVVATARVKIGDGIAGLVAKTGEPLVITGDTRMETFTNLEAKTVDIHSSISAPLMTRNRIIGVINVAHVRKTARPFTETELDHFLIYASYAAVILDQAHLYFKSKHPSLIHAGLSDTHSSES